MATSSRPSTQVRRPLHKMLRTLLVVVLTATGLVAIAGSPAHADTYRRFASAGFPVKFAVDDHPCWGYVYIRQEWSGYVYSYSSVDCGGASIWTINGKLNISNNNFGVSPYVETNRTCDWVAFCDTGVGMWGGLGQTYCAFVRWNVKTVANRSGSYGICIYT